TARRREGDRGSRRIAIGWGRRVRTRIAPQETLSMPRETRSTPKGFALTGQSPRAWARRKGIAAHPPGVRGGTAGRRAFEILALDESRASASRAPDRVAQRGGGAGARADLHELRRGESR